MSLEIPTTTGLADIIVSQLESSLSQTIPLLPKSFTRVLAKVLAGVFMLLYKYGGWIHLQRFIEHASFEETTINGKQVRPLVEIGRQLGVSDPDTGTRAEILIDVTVTEQTDRLPAGSLLLRSETGVMYQTLYPVDLDAATVQARCRAVSDQDGNFGVGEVGNLAAGDEVSFVNPLPNVSRVATADSLVTTGADAETGDEYRARVLARSQAKPQGGAYADYRTWGSEVSGVIRIYPYTSDNPGETDVFVEVDTDIDADGIPTQAILDDVYDKIQVEESGQATRRPTNSAVNVFPISRIAFDVALTGLAADADGDLTTLEGLVDDALDEHLRAREPFISGLDPLPRKNRITLGEVSGVVASICNAQGGSVVSVDLQLNGESISAFTLNYGQKAKFGSLL